MDQAMVFIMLASILIIGGILFWLVSRLTLKSNHIDVESYRINYLKIEQQLRPDNPVAFRLAVIDGDKLVDQAMRDCGIRGETMGERLKSAKNRFSDLNSLWQAHKLRNQVVHETNITVNYNQARQALLCYKRALKDLGAI